MLRGTLRAGVLGQDRSFSGQGPQSIASHHPAAANGSFPRSLSRKPPFRFRPKPAVRLRAHLSRSACLILLSKPDIRSTCHSARSDGPGCRHLEGEGRALTQRRILGHAAAKGGFRQEINPPERSLAGPGVHSCWSAARRLRFATQTGSPACRRWQRSELRRPLRPVPATHRDRP